MSDTSREATLERVPYIWYPVQFHRKNDKDKDKGVRAQIDSGNDINAMHPAYATKLVLCTRKINIDLQKIDGSYLDTFGIVIADCLVKNKLRRVRFFQRPFCWLILAWKWSWGCFSSLSARRTYDLWSRS